MCKYEVIIPALETSHAIYYAVQLANNMGPGKDLVINMSGWGTRTCRKWPRSWELKFEKQWNSCIYFWVCIWGKCVMVVVSAYMSLHLWFAVLWESCWIVYNIRNTFLFKIYWRNLVSFPLHTIFLSLNRELSACWQHHGYRLMWVNRKVRIQHIR